MSVTAILDACVPHYAFEWSEREVAAVWLIENGGANEPVLDSSVGEVGGGCLRARSARERGMLQHDVRRVGRRCMVESSAARGISAEAAASSELSDGACSRSL